METNTYSCRSNGEMFLRKYSISKSSFRNNILQGHIIDFAFKTIHFALVVSITGCTFYNNAKHLKVRSVSLKRFTVLSKTQFLHLNKMYIVVIIERADLTSCCIRGHCK